MMVYRLFYGHGVHSGVPDEEVTADGFEDAVRKSALAVEAWYLETDEPVTVVAEDGSVNMFQLKSQMIVAVTYLGDE